MIAIILGILLSLLGTTNVPAQEIVIVAPVLSEEEEWSEFHADAYAEYASDFDALFNSYETKWSKNNRLMMRQGSSGSYRFVAKA